MQVRAPQFNTIDFDKPSKAFTDKHYEDVFGPEGLNAFTESQLSYVIDNILLDTLDLLAKPMGPLLLKAIFLGNLEVERIEDEYGNIVERKLKIKEDGQIIEIKQETLGGLHATVADNLNEMYWGRSQEYVFKHQIYHQDPKTKSDDEIIKDFQQGLRFILQYSRPGLRL